MRIATLLLAIILLAPAKTTEAGSGPGIPLATEATQILNNLELLGLNVTQLEALWNQGQQLVNEAIMIEHMITNLLTLADDPLAFINALMQLSYIVEQGQVLSYVATNIDEQYEQMYPGYDEYVYEEMSPWLLRQKYSDWSNHNMDNIKAALKAAHIQEETLMAEEARLETIVYMSKTAEGRMQALQAGNLIAAESVSSLQRLRQLLMVNTQLMANHQAKTQDKEDISAVKWQQLTEGGETVVGDERSMFEDFQ